MYVGTNFTPLSKGFNLRVKNGTAQKDLLDELKAMQETSALYQVPFLKNSRKMAKVVCLIKI